MTILHIETSTNVCSVTLSSDGKVIQTFMDETGQNHAALLSPFIQQIIDNNKNIKIDAVAVSEGPGSYTGLRIGVSTAKGLCYGYDVPLIAVDTLSILCQEVISTQKLEENALLCPMIDARRMEVYNAIYDTKLNKQGETKSVIITEESFLELLNNNIVYFFGNGAEKCKSLITHSNARFIDTIIPLAKNMIAMAEEKFANKDFVDTAYFEPFYLKEFQATTPKKKA